MRQTICLCADCVHHVPPARYIKARDAHCAVTDNDVRSWWAGCCLWKLRENKEVANGIQPKP